MSSRIRVALPILVLFAHASLYGGWIIDDAGITFSYARNLIEGHGLVAQPGDLPLEGFTNLLWLLVLAATMWVGAFDPVVAPKLIGVTFAATALWLVRRTALREERGARLWIDAGVIATAANPAFAIWVASGLENGLTALLVALAYSSLARALPSPTRRNALVAGGIAALLFANRPDGALYAAVFPIAVLTMGDAEGRQRVGCGVIAAGTAAVGIGLVTLWRWLIFGDVVPNTFHAKGAGTSASAVLALAHGIALGIAAAVGPRLARTRLGDASLCLVIVTLFWFMGTLSPLRVLAGDLGWLLLAVAWWAFARRTVRPNRALWSFVLMALVQFCALPKDWMGEHRFGTALVLLAPTAIAATLGQEIARIQSRRAARVARALAAAIVVMAAIRYGVRDYRFLAEPVVPMANVMADFERTVARWAVMIGRADATVLTPDIGGVLWSGGPRVVDLAGLCDREIGGLVGGDRRALANHILEEVRPTFVMIHGRNAWFSGLTEDPRFEREYVGVHVWTGSWIREKQGVDAEVGSFVRRDSLPEGVTVATLRHASDESSSSPR